MKVTPIPSTVVPSNNAEGFQQAPSAVKSLKMKTNYNPTVLADAPQMPAEGINSEPTAAVEATQPLSPQLAFLAKQRRALQVKERELLARERAMKESTQTGQSSVDLARLKSEPLSVLLENGVTYEQLTEAILNNPQNNEVMALKKEIESLRQGIDQKFQDQNTQAEKQVLAEMKRTAMNMARNSDQYELINANNGVSHVMQLIERTYRESGEVLDVPEAMQLVEDELFKDAQKLIRLKKLQALQNPPVQQQQAMPPRHQGMRTLTNRDTATQVPMSARARAIAAFQGTLKR